MKKTAPAKKNPKIPTCRCAECGHERPAFGFVSLTSETGQPSRHLCSECYNRDYMQRAGLPELETVYFDPIVRYDSLGKAHTFHFMVMMSTGLGVKAFEYVNGGPGGYTFAVLEPPETPVRAAYAKLVARIEAGIAVHYLKSSDFPGAGASQNRLYAKGMAVNGRMEERDSGTRTVVIDGREYTWEQFGEFLSCYTGFDFRLECFDSCEVREITPNPVRPNPIWWLTELTRTERDDEQRYQ